MKITKLYTDSSLDFKVWGWKRVNEYATHEKIHSNKVMEKYIIAAGCEYIFGNAAAYAVSFNYSTLLKYDAVIYIGKTYVGDAISTLYAETFKNNHKLEWREKVYPASYNSDIFNAVCHCMEIPFIFVSTDNEISTEVAESYSGNGYYIITSPYELQHTLRKLNISKNAKVLLLQLDSDYKDDIEDTLTPILDAISVVENTLSNWK